MEGRSEGRWRGERWVCRVEEGKKGGGVENGRWMGRGGIREGRRKRIHRCEVFKGLRGGVDQVEGWAGLVQSLTWVSNGFGSSCGECQLV